MSHRNLTKTDFEGKTIREVDVTAANMVRFVFTDGTMLAIEVDDIGGGYGIYGIFACDECAHDERLWKGEACATEG